MFWKNVAESLDSFLGEKTDLKGKINVKGMLRVDGILNGQVNADCVVLGETATIKGDITARKIIVGGKVEGNLDAKEIVEIKPKGKVLGDISTNKLVIIEGGEFNGKIEMKMDEGKGIELEKRPNELKTSYP